ncbi:hypothetical protein LY76DRAFT_275003 [Colletotrichum caudatum]|nr:hypothetical protein LY76DRAFT_275003 [Colletotrichum caudatum]
MPHRWVWRTNSNPPGQRPTSIAAACLLSALDEARFKRLASNAIQCYRRLAREDAGSLPPLTRQPSSSPPPPPPPPPPPKRPFQAVPIDANARKPAPCSNSGNLATPATRKEEEPNLGREGRDPSLFVSSVFCSGSAHRETVPSISSCQKPAAGDLRVWTTLERRRRPRSEFPPRGIFFFSFFFEDGKIQLQVNECPNRELSVQLRERNHRVSRRLSSHSLTNDHVLYSLHPKAIHLIGTDGILLSQVVKRTWH